jgi:urate oxidase
MSVGDYQILGETTKKIYFTSIFESEFRFTYTCGYTTTPETMKTALLKMVSDLYEYRESSVEATKPSANLMTAYELMKPFKRINIII